MTQLRACDACSRHVFVTEKVCPFCSAPLAAAAPRTFGQRLRRGMSRAQLLAVAAAMTGQTLGACDDTPQNDGRPGGAGGEAGTVSGGTDGGSAGTGGAAGMAGAGAGGAGTGGAGAGGSAGAGAGGTGGDDMSQPVYGSPVDPDASVVVDAGADAGDDAGEMFIPLYGGSPIPDPVPND